MLGFTSFYYRTTRKIIIAMGSLFNGIDLIKYDANTNAELDRRVVPCTYEGKETYITRLLADPDALRGTQINLPAMTYELTNIQYDPQRKLTPYIKNQFIQTGNTSTSFALATPYNIAFDLNLYVRNMEDGLQIIEQIIPFFNPDYTVALKYLVSGGTYISDNVPIVLEAVDFENDYQGEAGSVRMISWTLKFTAKVLYFGPVPSRNVIKEVIVTLHDDSVANTYNTNVVYANTTAVIDTKVTPITANITDTWTANTTITTPSGT